MARNPITDLRSALPHARALVWPAVAAAAVTALVLQSLWLSGTGDAWLVGVALISGAAVLVLAVPVPLALIAHFRSWVGRLDAEMVRLDERNQAYQLMVAALATAIDAKDRVTHAHVQRVRHYCLALARHLGVCDPDELQALEAAALLHDIGKIGVPERILNKPGRLDADEFSVMKRHVDFGVQILSTARFPFPLVPIVRHHHECWDGRGYPDGLRGEDIPLGARILMVVDCFDALSSDRPYRRALSVDDAFDVLRGGYGSMYDPRVVDAFIELYPKVALDDEPVSAPPVSALHAPVAVGH